MGLGRPPVMSMAINKDHLIQLLYEYIGEQKAKYDKAVAGLERCQRQMREMQSYVGITDINLFNTLKLELIVVDQTLKELEGENG